MCKILEVILKKQRKKFFRRVQDIFLCTGDRHFGAEDEFEQGQVDMDIKKNDIFTTTIEDMSDQGAGIGKTDGYTWFIKDTVVGDVVEASAMKMKKSYGYGRLIRVIKPSDARVEPPCPVARQCGGCQLQAMSYEEQLKFKENKVYNNLVRIGKIGNLRRVTQAEAVGLEQGEAGLRQEEAGPGQEAAGLGPETSRLGPQAAGNGECEGERSEEKAEFFPIMGMENPWRYRNKAQFPFGRDKEGNIVTGFFAERTHAIIPQEDCLLGIEENPKILKIIKDFMIRNHISVYEEESHRGLIRHVLIRKGFRTGELMVCLVINGKNMPRMEELIGSLKEMKGMTSISYNINTEKTNVIMGKESVHVYGPGFITDYIGDVKYRISPLSFYQVNPVQTEKLYQTALEYAGLTGDEVVWDLYCGIGTISLFLAQKAQKVYGVEIVSQAVDDARENASLNGFDNVEFFVGKAEEVLPEWYERNRERADVIVVDPPRKGCDETCLDTIVEMGPDRVVYVSCDSATLARDLRYLCDRGYEVRKVRCCDMFGETGHVETVCLLSNRKPDSYVHLNLKMEDYYRIKDAQKEQDKK